MLIHVWGSGLPAIGRIGGRAFLEAVGLMDAGGSTPR
jgi:hypothetical protein